MEKHQKSIWLTQNMMKNTTMPSPDHTAPSPSSITTRETKPSPAQPSNTEDTIKMDGHMPHAASSHALTASTSIVKEPLSPAAGSASQLKIIE